MDGGDGKKYFNVFNIGASGNGSGNIIANARNYAKSKGWDTLQKSLEGGIDEIFSNWLGCKQDTMYLNKFDVEAKGGTLTHQYMQNIEAPHSESISMYNKLKDTGILNNSLTFVIPVFRNMPSYASPIPSSTSTSTPKNIKLKAGHTDWNVRSAADTNSSIVATIADDKTIVLSTQRDNNGWHRVVLTNGKKGYIKYDSSAWEETADVTNCDEDIAVYQDTELRAGPGKDEKAIRTLISGQIMSRVDNTGRYVFDGLIWDRVVMNDGTKGFISRDHVNADPGVYRVKVDDSLRMRSSAGFSGEVIRLLPNGTKVLRLDIASSMVDGYYWDRVITGTGIVGYVARSYLIDVNGNAATGSEVKKSTKPFTPSAANKVGDKNTTDNTIKMEPKVTVKEILEKYSGAVIKDKSGKQITDKSVKVGTGYTITVDGKAYTIIKLGDVSGNGIINSADVLAIRQSLNGKLKLDAAQSKASDVTKNDSLNSADVLAIRQFLNNKLNLSL
jgi:uncharacterized protein YgiM (DUF1202 family)